MAKKIFRLHKGGVSDESGWFKSSRITSKDLDTILTDGKDAATSIPTPFATLDLVKTAFKWVSEHKIKGDSAHHKLVSDALDVAQLFYVSPRYKNKIRIIAWNPATRFQDLVNSSDIKHKRFFKTLKLFWEQDGAFGFDNVERIYLILNKHNNKVIGGTSPESLFFAAPDVRKVAKGLDVEIAQDKLFDDTFASLPERENSFVEYIYAISKQPNFSSKFPEIYEYLEKVKDDDLLNSSLKTEISNFDSDTLKSYNKCPVLENEMDVCEISGIKLGIESDGIEPDQSDFLINADFNNSEEMPLILPQYPFTEKWTYTTRGVLWNEDTRTPYKNTESPENSRLPKQHNEYYWLSAGNFFEDVIFKLPYPIDSTNFLTCGSKNHLLPLTPTFFKYFKSENIVRLLTIKERAGGNVDVELKIPVKGGNIIFKKQYSLAENNIKNFAIHLTVFPFLRSKKFKIKHNIGLLDDRLDKSSELFIGCFKEGKDQNIGSAITRNPGTGGELTSKYFKTLSQPDVVYIKNEANSGFLVPLMKEYSGISKINFAIDFGTTNTHIEYKKGEDVSKAFDNLNSSPLWQSLLNPENKKIDPLIIENEIIFEQEVLPRIISKNKQNGFPLRTALVYNNDVDFNNKVEIIREVNNYLLLEEVPLTRTDEYLKLETDIKWSNYSDTIEEKKVESYLEFLTTIVYYKTLQLGGSPKNTFITWFYPVSMDEGEREVFFDLWKKIFKKVFETTPKDQIIGIPESIAPYLYYKSSVAGLSLSIDIGGGSSDLAVFDEDDKNAKLISSFKFAGNAIFGDGYPSKELSSNSDRNGYVKAFKSVAQKAVGNKDKILSRILNNRKNSADFSSYLFALEQKDSMSFSYSNLLRKNTKLKLTMLIFYGAVAYYSAKLLKKSNISIPKYLLLSGTASKTSAILDPSDDLKNLSYLFQFIFEYVHGEKSKQDIQIKLSPIPKEVTCKGALKAEIDKSVKDTPIKFWIGGTTDNSWSKALDRDKDFQDIPEYNRLNDNHKKDIEKSLLDFYKVLDLYTDEVNIKSKYLLDVNSYDIFKEMRERDIKDFLTKGINSFYKKSDSKIEESLFFYPLIGILNKLSFELAENSK